MKAIQLKAIAVAVAAAFAMFSSPVVLAQDDGGGVGKGQMGPSGEHGKRGDTPIGGRGQGQGGPSGDSDAKGPRYGGGSASPEPGDRGGRPAWSGGGVPEDVELGRLNVARSPSQVLDRALAEALLALQTDATLYNMASLDAVIAAIYDGTVFRVDSPLQNLALYKDLVVDGQIGDGSVAFSSDTLMLAAIFIGSASDKLIAVTPDTVNALNTIMGLTLPSGITAESLATAADAVRTAIYNEHEGITP